MNDRNRLRMEFTRETGWGDAKVFPLVPDASFRHYYRLVLPDRSAIVMDAPPESENINPFLTITYHLQRLGIRTPEIFSWDARNGFILLEDLGDKTFTTQLNSGGNALLLYQKAIEILADLHSTPDAIQVGIGKYDFDRLIDEVGLFTRWYLPAVIGAPVSAQQEIAYIAAWKSIYTALPDIGSTLVLRDYHVDNLILANDQCAVLDYQDALIGSPAYDVVSLLEDARRDLDENITTKTMEVYFRHHPNVDREAFDQHYRVWGAQRHCKVAGIFMRLWLRDNKPHYLKHLSRVTGLLRNSLAHPALGLLCQWFVENDVSLDYQDPAESRAQILSRTRG